MTSDPCFSLKLMMLVTVLYDDLGVPRLVGLRERSRALLAKGTTPIRINQLRVLDATAVTFAHHSPCERSNLCYCTVGRSYLLRASR